MIATPVQRFLVTRSTAHAKKTHHQMVAGLGYVAHSGPPELPPGSDGSANCDPPATTADGSVHLLRPPNGARPIAMKWVVAERAWESMTPDRGNRLAWPADFLKKAGWAYMSAAPIVLPEPER